MAKQMQQMGLVAEKLGMTRVFDENGRHIPVTVLQVRDCQVTQIKTPETDGYTAIQLGAFAQKESRMSKPVMGHCKKAGVDAKREFCEFRVESTDGFSVGQEVKADLFEAGQWIDVAGTTVGKGFAGAMKRWNFGGMRASHGVSISHRAHGSTGQNQDPGKVFKGKKMAGHMGQRRRTQQNLQVFSVDADRGVLMVRGSVPGSAGSIVYVKKAVKKS